MLGRQFGVLQSPDNSFTVNISHSEDMQAERIKQAELKREKRRLRNLNNG